MPQEPGDVVQGTLDMLILKTLALEPMHGFGIATRIEQMSKGVFRVNGGSLFVAFKRLQRAGWIRGEWRATENNRQAQILFAYNFGKKQTAVVKQKNGDAKRPPSQEFWKLPRRRIMFRKITDGLRSLFRREKVDRESDAEIRGYLDDAAREKMKSGMSREEALRRPAWN